MALSYSAFDLAVLHLLDCIGEALEIEGRCNRHVVRWQKQFYLSSSAASWATDRA